MEEKKFLGKSSLSKLIAKIEEMFAFKSHNHSKSDITDFPTSMKNPTSLTIKFNGTTNSSYDGSTQQTINITPSAIGASASGHIHDDRYYNETEIDFMLNGKADSTHKHEEFETKISWDELTENVDGKVTIKDEFVNGIKTVVLEPNITVADRKVYRLATVDEWVNFINNWTYGSGWFKLVVSKDFGKLHPISVNIGMQKEGNPLEVISQGSHAIIFVHGVKTTTDIQRSISFFLLREKGVLKICHIICTMNENSLWTLDYVTKESALKSDLPVQATETTLGTVKATPKTDDMTQQVGIGEDGLLYVSEGGKTYTAGTNISISDEDVISLDESALSWENLQNNPLSGIGETQEVELVSVSNLSMSQQGVYYADKTMTTLLDSLTTPNNAVIFDSFNIYDCFNVDELPFDSMPCTIETNLWTKNGVVSVDDRHRIKVTTFNDDGSDYSHLLCNNSDMAWIRYYSIDPNTDINISNIRVLVNTKIRIDNGLLHLRPKYDVANKVYDGVRAATGAEAFNDSKAIGYNSHAEGYATTASGFASHVEGYLAKAIGGITHAEGYGTTAKAAHSHVEGYYTIAGGQKQHVQGQYNIEDTSNTYAHIVGNGTSESKRSNAHTVDWSGNAWYQGKVSSGTVENPTVPENPNDLITKKYFEEASELFVPIEKKVDVLFEHSELQTQGSISNDANKPCYVYSITAPEEQLFNIYPDEKYIVYLDDTKYVVNGYYVDGVYSIGNLIINGMFMINGMSRNPNEYRTFTPTSGYDDADVLLFGRDVHDYIVFSKINFSSIRIERETENISNDYLDILEDKPPEVVKTELFNQEVTLYIASQSALLYHRPTGRSDLSKSFNFVYGKSYEVHFRDMIFEFTMNNYRETIHGENCLSSYIHNSTDEFEQGKSYIEVTELSDDLFEMTFFIDRPIYSVETMSGNVPIIINEINPLKKKVIKTEYLPELGKTYTGGNNIVITDDNVIDYDDGILHVNFIVDNAGNISCNKTFKEIDEALGNGLKLDTYMYENAHKCNCIVIGATEEEISFIFVDNLTNLPYVYVREFVYTADGIHFAGDEETFSLSYSQGNGIQISKDNVISLDKTALSLTGLNTTGKTYVFKNGTEIIAAEGAEIFNDYRELKYGSGLHQEGNVATGEYSHAEGIGTEARGDYSHAENDHTVASGRGSHAEGDTTHAKGDYSHAEGYNTYVTGLGSHAEGYYTKASGDYQHVSGKLNVPDEENRYATIVGNGNDDGDVTEYINIHTLDWNGNSWYAGKVSAADPTEPNDLVTSKYFDDNSPKVLYYSGSILKKDAEIGVCVSRFNGYTAITDWTYHEDSAFAYCLSGLIKDKKVFAQLEIYDSTGHCIGRYEEPDVKFYYDEEDNGFIIHISDEIADTIGVSGTSIKYSLFVTEVSKNCTYDMYFNDYVLSKSELVRHIPDPVMYTAGNKIDISKDNVISVDMTGIATETFVNDAVDVVSAKIDEIPIKRFINVLDKGAVGDGVTDDTQAFIDAITEGLDTETPVYIPGGYKFKMASVPREGIKCWKYCSPTGDSPQPEPRRSIHMFGDGAAFSHIIWDATNKYDKLFVHCEFAIFRDFMITDSENAVKRKAGHAWPKAGFKGIVFATPPTSQTFDSEFSNLRIFGTYYMGFYRRFTMLENYKNIVSGGIACHYCFALGDGGLNINTDGTIDDATAEGGKRAITEDDLADAYKYPWHPSRKGWNQNGVDGQQGWFHNGVVFDNVTCEGGECGIFGGLMCANMVLVCCQNINKGDIGLDFLPNANNVAEGHRYYLNASSCYGIWLIGRGSGDMLRTNHIGSYYTEALECPIRVDSCSGLIVDSMFVQGSFDSNTKTRYKMFNLRNSVVNAGTIHTAGSWDCLCELRSYTNANFTSGTNTTPGSQLLIGNIVGDSATVEARADNITENSPNKFIKNTWFNPTTVTLSNF